MLRFTFSPLGTENANVCSRCPSEGLAESGVMGTESVEGLRIVTGNSTARSSTDGRGLFCDVVGTISDSEIKSDR